MTDKEKNIEYEIIEAEPAREASLDHILYSLGGSDTQELEAMRILYLHTLGYSRNQIAMHYRMSAKRVQEIMRSEEFRIMAKDYTKNTLMLTKLSITMMSEKAMQTMVELLNSKNEKTRYTVAKDLLDRAGLVGKQLVEITDNTGYDSLDDDRLQEVVMKSMHDILGRKEIAKDGESESDESTHRAPQEGSV